MKKVFKKDLEDGIEALTEARRLVKALAIAAETDIEREYSSKDLSMIDQRLQTLKIRLACRDYETSSVWTRAEKRLLAIGLGGT